MTHRDNEYLRVRVRRSEPGSQSEFEVQRFTPMTVLDALMAVYRDHDPTLGFRFSCRVAMCGTCTVRVDGRAALACQTPIRVDAAEVTVEPAAGFPVVRDLVVDTTAFWEEWVRVTPWLVPREDLEEPALVRPDSAEREAIDPALDCIQCGACFSGCAVSGAGRTFLGPAALTRAMVLLHDSRDEATEQRLEVVTGADGVDRCHFVYACSEVCPKGLDPAAAIRAVRTGRSPR